MKRRISLLLTAFFAVLAMSLGATASESPVRVKAAFLYKFCSYVEWPETSFAEDDSPLIIGVIGSDRMEADLSEITRNRLVGKHPISIKRIVSLTEIPGLHVLFLGEINPEQGVGFEISTKPILVVTDESGLPPYSTINFVTQNHRIRFEVSRSNALKSGLKISSQLLAVASRVM